MDARQKYNVADNLYVMYISHIGLLSVVFGICTFIVIYAHFRSVRRRTFRLLWLEDYCRLCCCWNMDVL